jgi:large subunit ribosomal protein L18
MQTKLIRSKKRQTRIRTKIRQVTDRPRLSVFRSNHFMYAQIIDDTSGKTVVGISEKVLSASKGTRVDRAKALGNEIAKLAKEKKITAVVFDKGSYAYHGRVKALAEGAREGGLQF